VAEDAPSGILCSLCICTINRMNINAHVFSLLCMQQVLTMERIMESEISSHEVERHKRGR
jgi:hypothetical protein